MNQSRDALALTFSYGLFSAIIQLALIRLAGMNFYGNEITYCIVLGHWLFWTGTGSFFFRSQKPKSLSNLIIAWLFSVFISYQLILLLRPILSLDSGTIVSAGTIFLVTLPPVGITAFLNGRMFPYLIQKAPNPISHLYIAEVLGAAIGALICYGLLLCDSNTLITLNLMTIVFVVLTFIFENPSAKFTKILLIIIIFLNGFMLMKGNYLLLQKIWQPYDFQFYTETANQAVIQTELESTSVVFSNSSPIWTKCNIENAEEFVHFALLAHPNPRSLVIAGTVTLEIIDELEKYESLHRVFIINNDKKLQQILTPHFTGDSKYHFIYQDAFQHLRQMNRKFDIILINQSAPQNLLTNRFYTQEFFELANNCLTNSGVFDISLTGSETFLSQDHIELLRVTYASLQQVFSNITMIPGNQVHFLGIKSDIKPGLKYFINEMINRQIENLYVQNYYLYDRLSVSKQEFLQTKLDSVDSSMINSIWQPAAFYFNTILWARQTSNFLAVVNKWLKTINPILVITVVFFTLGLLGFRQITKPSVQRVMFLAGIFGMGSSATLILLYQSLVGNLFSHILLLNSAFMSGAALGANNYYKQKQQNLFPYLLFLLILMPVSFILCRITTQSILHQISIFVAMFSVGQFNGRLFPHLSTQLSQLKTMSAAQSGGRIYGLDILGSCMGIYLISMFVIPVWGIDTAFALLGSALLFLVFWTSGAWE